VNACVFGTFIAAGQTCIAGTRYLVHEKIYDEFKEKLIQKVKNI
jgi:acyl-CoA reductase-like NAD-dependent aldehyde dehydrogenase